MPLGVVGEFDRHLEGELALGPFAERDRAMGKTVMEGGDDDLHLTRFRTGRKRLALHDAPIALAGMTIAIGPHIDTIAAVRADRHMGEAARLGIGIDPLPEEDTGVRLRDPDEQQQCEQPDHCQPIA